MEKSIKNRIMKRGFTLVELLAVIAILAILVVLAVPSILKMFNESKKNTFITQAQSIYKTSEQQYISDQIKNSQTSIYCKTKSDNTYSLSMSGNNKVYYYIEYTNGKITSFQVTDGTKYSITLANATQVSMTDIKKDNLDDPSVKDTSCSGLTYANVYNGLRILAGGGNAVSLNNANPGDKVTKTVTIENITETGKYYDLTWDISKNEYNPTTDLVYTVSSVKGANISKTTMPTSDANISTNIPIEPGETHTYQVDAEFLNTGGDQSSNSNKKFEGEIVITPKQEEYTPVVQQPTDVVKVGSTYYTSIQSAINATNTSNIPLELLKNTSECGITITSGKNIILNLNGKTITCNYATLYTLGRDATIENEGTLTIDDYTQSKEGKVENTDGLTIYNMGNLTVNNGHFIVSGGVYTADNSNFQAMVFDHRAGTMVINNAIATNNSTLSKNIYVLGAKTGNVTINNGTFTETNTSATLGASLSISGDSSLTINNGTFTGITEGATAYTTGTIIINNGTFNGSKYGLVIAATSNTTINNGTFTGASYAGIHNETTGSITVNNAIVTGQNNGIYNKGTGTIIVKGGTITGNAYQGVYNNSTGTITIGNTSTAFNIDSPKIYSKSTNGYAISMNGGGILNFYNGSLYTKYTGTSSAIYSNGATINLRYGYSLSHGTITESGVSYKRTILAN